MRSYRVKRLTWSGEEGDLKLDEGRAEVTKQFWTAGNQHDHTLTPTRE
jgi:hypothetical protein